jgi:hypothetical protein
MRLIHTLIHTSHTIFIIFLYIVTGITCQLSAVLASYRPQLDRDTSITYFLIKLATTDSNTLSSGLHRGRWTSYWPRIPAIWQVPGCSRHLFLCGLFLGTWVSEASFVVKKAS